MKSITATILLALCFSSQASATILEVPGRYATIQSAVNAAGDGDVILISKGTYSEAVLISNEVRLKLQGRGKVIIDPAGAGVGLRIDDSHEITIKNLKIQNTGGQGIAIALSSDIRIEHCDLRNTGSSAIKAVDSSCVTVFNNSIRNADQCGIRMGAKASLIKQNKIDTVTNGSGILVEAENVSVFDNLVQNCDVNGIVAADGTRPQQILFAGNRVRNVAHGLKTAYLSDGVSIVDNVVRGTDDNTAGIYLGGEGHYASHNSVKQAGAGILIEGFDCAVHRNRVTSPARDGLFLMGDGNLIDRNTFRKARRHGVWILSGASANLLCDNQATRSRDWDLQNDSPATSNDLIDNTFPTIAP